MSEANVQPEAPSITNGQPHEPTKHFAVIFTSELEPNKPAKLRPVKKTRATRAAIEAGIESGIVKTDTATLQGMSIVVHIVSHDGLRKELQPYVRIG